MNITARSIPLGVIGSPVAHSISPEIHNFIIDSMVLNYFYCAFPVKKGNVKAALDGIRALGIGGVNVTVPHKETVFRYCDKTDPFAEMIGAVNTLVNDDGILTGYNTDAPGFIKNLHRSGVGAEGKKCAVLGAGGAAKGVAAALLADGAAELMIINRTHEKAEKMASELNKFYGGKVRAACAPNGAEILVNTTSVGMKSQESPFNDFGILSEKCIVCDIVYCPRETAFIKAAKKCGHKTVGGIGMLIYQAVIAFEYFTRKKVSSQTIEKLFDRLEMSKNIVLTGFMGCGKSSIGREIAQMSGSELIDCDSYIVEKTGMSIPEIFDQKGETAFRDIESQCIRELSKKSGVIISLGGGAVLRRENIEVLRENGLIFRIKASPEKILKNTAGDTGRPLLKGKTPEQVRELMAVREPYYENCDYSVDVSETCPNESAHRIMDIVMEEVSHAAD